MAKTCLHISFAIILTLFVVNLNANPKPKADNGIDIIINRLGPRLFGLRKPDTGAGHWDPNGFWIPPNSGPEPRKPDTGAGHWGPNGFWMPRNPGPEPKEVERPAEDYPSYRPSYLRSGVLDIQPNIVFKCCPLKLVVQVHQKKTCC